MMIVMIVMMIVMKKKTILSLGKHSIDLNKV